MEAVNLDKLQKALKYIGPERTRMVLVKDRMLTMRVTEAELASIKRTAAACKLSMTDYLTRLHRLAKRRLDR